MTTQRWQQIEGVFQTVLEAPEPQRPGVLEEACGEDRELRREVETLLACYGKGESYLAGAIEKEANQLAEKGIESFVGRRLGNYKLTRLLGRGGMGVVYLGTREDPDFQQQVAIKLMKRGMDSEETVRRFRTERRILARLDHPNIARLLDGGTTEEGLPYLVMEYVDGAPLLDYCRQHSLSLRDRLSLFRAVCAAVHFAHQHLVVHRDLKPQNILVTVAGGEPQVKLLDFGIAKMLSEDSAHTRTGAILLTPNYASPEQIHGKPVTTASDIYALGIVLYELLTGKRPHEIEDPSPAALALAVCEKEPLPPSRHKRELKGDLDNIALMALRKEPDRRYASAEQFSEDIRRYLAGLPVIARQDTVLYRATKFVRRNKLATAAVLFAWLALSSGLGIAMWQARRAERGRNEARQFISKVLVNSFVRLRMVPGTLAAQRDFANESLVYLNKLAAESGHDPNTQLDLAVGYFWVAQIQATIGRMSLGRWEDSLRTGRQALVLAEQMYRRNPSDPVNSALMASLCHHIQNCYRALGNPHEALAWGKRSRPFIPASSAAAYDKVGAPQLKTTLPAVATAGVLNSLGQYRAALDELGWPDIKAASLSPLVAGSHALAGIGDIEGARKLIRGGMSRPVQHTYGNILLYADLVASLALVEGHPMRINLGNGDAGAALLRQSVDEDLALLSSDGDNEALASAVAIKRVWLAGMVWRDKPDEAIGLYRAAAEFYRKAILASTRNLSYRREAIRMEAEFAELSSRLKQQADALEHLGRATALEKAIAEPQAYTRLIEGNIHARSGERGPAIESYQEAVKLEAKAVAERPEDMEARREQADCLETLAQFYAAAGEWREAREAYGRSLAIWRDWTNFGVSSAYNQRREKETAAALASAERMAQRQ